MSRIALEDLAARARDLAGDFAATAADNDRAGAFPDRAFARLRTEGWPGLPVPTAFGGAGAGLRDIVGVTETLAEGDGSAALALAMHFQTLGSARDGGQWRPDVAERVFREVAERGALVNACASEPELGSPSRGGLPRTTARRTDTGWVIDGRKNFASMAAALDYFVIPAATDDGDPLPIGRFLVGRAPGVTVEDNWDPLGMRATGSHDVVLDRVEVPRDSLLYRESPEPPHPFRLPGNAWFILVVTSVYLGVGAAALRAAAAYALQRIPVALGKPIATLETVQRRLGVADTGLRAARALVRAAAQSWDDDPGARDRLAADLVAAKITGTNAALAAAAEAMRIVGGAAMRRDLPFERLLRDAQAGLYHPPADDAGAALLGRLALREHGWEGA
jgi:alkylation response protein AidB-like acyl-CoA dehydrogenase